MPSTTTVQRLQILLIVNSFASSVTARNQVVIDQILGDIGDVTVRVTNRRGHATRFAKDAASKNIDLVVALGGDGTLNEAANGLAGSDTALAPLPGGSTNVFARSIGLPNDPVAAARLVASAVKSNSIRRVGLGRVNGRYFCFHTGVGFDAAVVARVEERASVKRWFGHPLFIYAGLRTFAASDRRNPAFDVAHSTRPPYSGSFTIVLNTNPYTYLGNRPLDLAPESTLDNALSTVTFSTLSLPTIGGGIVRALAGGGIRGRGIVKGEGLSNLSIQSDRAFPYQVDGDYLGETRRLDFVHCPGVLALVMAVSPSP